jgi:hypothetical protein
VESKHSNIIYLDEAMLGDEKTGLQWRESSDTDGLIYYQEAATGELYGTVSWREATGWVEHLSSMNPGWRLPTILELMGLFELGVPLAEAIDPAASPLYWAEGRRPDSWAKGRPTDAWTKPSAPNSVSLPILYWACMRRGLLTTFSPTHPFRCGMTGNVTNVLAVRDWKPLDIGRYTPEELIEQLGFIWVVHIPAAPCFDVVDSAGNIDSSRVIPLSEEAKRAEKKLLMMGVKAVPALLAVLAEPKLRRLPMDSTWDGLDRTLFGLITSRWGSDEAEKIWGGDERALRLRPNLVRQGALRILTQLRTDGLLPQNVEEQLDDIMLGIEKSAGAPPKPSFLRRLFGL